MRLVYSRRALADLQRIATYYAANASPRIAQSIERRLVTVIERICRLPEAAPRVSQRSQVRVTAVVRYPFRIFYRVRHNRYPAHPAYVETAFSNNFGRVEPRFARAGIREEILRTIELHIVHHARNVYLRPKKNQFARSVMPPTNLCHPVRCGRTSMSRRGGELGKMTTGFRYAHQTFLFHMMRCDMRRLHSSVTT